MLNDNDIKALLLKAQSEDIKIKKHAINELTENNLNLVRSIVQRFQNRGYEFEDLFQIGCIGLVKAIERFDLNRDLRFSTYAVPLIIGEIRRFLRDDGAIKVSRSLKELGFKIAQVREQFQKDFSRDPTINEIADLLNISQEEITMALEASQAHVSLYEKVYDSGEKSSYLIDQISEQQIYEREFIDEISLKEIIKKLPERQKMIIFLRFFADKTQKDIADYLNISQVQVSRIEKEALKLMHSYLLDKAQ